jgi:DNA-binding NtrC family response regulator
MSSDQIKSPQHEELSRERIAPLQLLVTSKDREVHRSIYKPARHLGFITTGAEDRSSTRAILKERAIDVVLLDLDGDDDAEVALFKEIRRLHPESDIVVAAGSSNYHLAAEALRAGAVAVLRKPLHSENIKSAMEQVKRMRLTAISVRRSREILRSNSGPRTIVGESVAIKNLCAQIEHASRSSDPILIIGGHGSGKELVARTIHFNSSIELASFVRVDCEAPASLVEVELFGVQELTNSQFRGLLRSSFGTTLFFDQISELSPRLQTMLMDSIRNSNQRKIRLMASASDELNQMVTHGMFRKDLFARFNLRRITVPSLAERKDDIAVLARHFLEASQVSDFSKRVLSDDAVRLLTEYNWSGNVAELELVVRRAASTSSTEIITGDDLPKDIRLAARKQRQLQTEESLGETIEAGNLSVAELEKRAIFAVLQRVAGDKIKAAAELGIGRTTLYRKLNQYGV